MPHGETRLTMRRHPGEAARARQHVRDHCAGLPGDVQATVQLLTSELVTNAIQHGLGPIELRLTSGEGSLRVEVSDESPVRPGLGRPSPDQTRGRGLMVVEAFAHSWGVSSPPGSRGKSVWFTVRTP